MIQQDEKGARYATEDEYLPYYLTDEGWAKWQEGDDDGDDTENGTPTIYVGTKRATFVVVHEIDRVYGGPEEGGWWFNCGTAVLSVVVASLDEARTQYRNLYHQYVTNVACRRCGAAADEHDGNEQDDVCRFYAAPDVGSIAYDGGAYSVSLSRSPAADYPQNRPHYE